MKRLVLIGIVFGTTAAWTATAQDAQGRQGLSEEQAQQRKAVIEKYDTDGDGVLSKSEQKQLSKGDKKTLAKTGGIGTAGKAPKEPKQKPAKEQKRERDQSQAGDQKASAPDKSKESREAKGNNGDRNAKGKGGRQ